MTKKQPTKQTEAQEAAQVVHQDLADVLKLAYSAAMNGNEVPEPIGKQIDAGTKAAYGLTALLEKDPQAYNAVMAIGIAHMADKLKLDGQARSYAHQLAASYAQKAGLEPQKEGPAYKPPSAAPEQQGKPYASIGELVNRLVGGQGAYGHNR